jgi:hypothetical protein
VVKVVVDFFKTVLWGIYNGVASFMRAILMRGDVNPNTNGMEFVMTFRQALRNLHMENDIKVRFFERSFIELCTIARSERRPILVFMLNDQSDETFRFTANALSDREVQGSLNSNFMLYGMFREHVDINLERVLTFPPMATLSVWMLTVGHDENITIQSRHYGMADEFMPDNFLNYLHQNLELYHVLIEEDPEYRGIQIL